MGLFTGSGTAIITPMSKDAVDFETLGELIEFQLANKTDAIVICGTTGEAPTLTDEEHMACIKYACQKVAGRVPVIAGTGSNFTQHAIDMSVYAQEVGADGVLIVTPYYNKSTQRGLVQHFTAIADAIDIPVILYNVPGRTSVNIEPQTVLELSKHKNINAIKEASGNISYVAEVARLVPDDFYIYSGNDDMITPLMSLGGHGVISVVSNIMPKETHDIVQSYLDGDVKASAKLQLDLKPLIDALFCEVNPIPVKTALALMGYNVGILRLPLYEMAQENLERLTSELKNYNLI